MKHFYPLLSAAAAALLPACHVLAQTGGPDAPARAAAKAVAADQDPAQPTWKSESSPVPAGAPAAMAEIDQPDLAKHAFELTGSKYGGRHTGTPGQVLAAQYVAGHFEALGLEPLGDEQEDGTRSYFQAYPVQRTYLDSEKTHITIAGERHTDGFGVLPGQKSADLDLEGRLVFCGNGGRDAIPELAEGSIAVVVLPPRNRKTQMRSEIQFMMGFRELNKAGQMVNRITRAGASTVLVLDFGERLADVMQYGALNPHKPLLAYGSEMGMGRMLSSMAPPSSLVVCGAPLGEKILAAMKMSIDEKGRVSQSGPAGEVKSSVGVRVLREGKFECLNVAAVLRGSDPDLASEAVVYSAHMDHMGTRLDGEIFNGADDNASGTAGMLEVAAAFAKGERPKRSVIFLSVSGEELGLWGSDYFSDNPTWPVEDLVANVNIDMIGRNTELSDADAISITPSYRHKMFSSIGRYSATIAEHFDFDLTIGDEFYERSDHYNFAKKGIPVVFFCDGEHEDYHRVSDTADKLNYDKMERVARLAYWTGWSVAQQADRPTLIGRSRGWGVDEDGVDERDLTEEPATGSGRGR